MRKLLQLIVGKLGKLIKIYDYRLFLHFLLFKSYLYKHYNFNVMKLIAAIDFLKKNKTIIIQSFFL